MTEKNRPQIPAIIHYCWFGRQEMPASAVRCIDSWRRFAPGYRLQRWDESNFDVNSSEYAAQAFRHRKYAFVSDVARLYALLSEGGIYLDTDVELLKTPDPLRSHAATTGFESSGMISTAVISSEKDNPLLREFLDIYSRISFIGKDGRPDLTPNTFRFTEFLKTKGLRADGSKQSVAGMNVLPYEYLSPLNQEGYRIESTADTICIHHFESSWKSRPFRLKSKLQRMIGPAATMNLIKLKRLIVPQSCGRTRF